MYSQMYQFQILQPQHGGCRLDNSEGDAGDLAVIEGGGRIGREIYLAQKKVCRGRIGREIYSVQKKGVPG